MESHLYRRLGVLLLAASLPLGICPAAHGADAYVRAPFLQVDESLNGEESARGIFHYLGDRRRVILEVVDPLSQWIVANSAETSVYYPESGETFRMEGAGPSPYQIFAAFCEGAPWETALSVPGFEPCSTAIRGDSLESWWEPASRTGEKGARVRWVIVEDLPSRFEVRDGEGRAIVTIRFDRFVEFEGKRVPLEVVSETLGEGIERQSITFSLPTFSVDAPESIRSFSVPRGTR